MLRFRAIIVAALFVLVPGIANAACWQWSTTASTNATADPSINWSEGMSPSSVNDSARAMMARLAECRDDLSGKLTTGGTSTAYTLTTNQASIAATPADGQSLTFRPHATSGAAPTLAVDGGTAWPIESAPSVAVATGALVLGSPYAVTFSTSSSSWLLRDYYAVTVDLDQFCSTRGAVLSRGSGGWACITPGADGTLFTSNGSGADPTWEAAPPMTPQGYLTPTSGVTVVTADVSAATTIYYTPDVGSIVPIYNGTVFVNTVFTELTLDLSSGSQASSNIYDVFIFDDSGTTRAAFGPSWSAGGGSVAAGSGARGTSSGSTELQRVNGIWTNKNAISAANNGAVTYSISANRGTYVGSVFVNATAGQVSLHRSYGQSRKWGIWNAYNRKPIYLKAGDATASWAYTNSSFRAANSSSSNSLTVFTGLDEEQFDVRLSATNSAGTSGDGVVSCGIGWNSTSSASGSIGRRTETIVSTAKWTVLCNYIAVPDLGINVVTILESASSSGSSTFYGGEDDNLLIAGYRG